MVWDQFEIRVSLPPAIRIVEYETKELRKLTGMPVYRGRDAALILSRANVAAIINTEMIATKLTPERNSGAV